MIRSLCIFLVCPLLAFSSVPYPRNHGRAFYTLDRFIQSHLWDKAGQSVRKGLSSGALVPAEIEMLANTYPDSAFAKAYLGTKAILDLPEKTGLTLATAFPITLFAESDLSDEALKGTTFWRSRLYGRELQYDPETTSIYIHLGTKGVKPIGEGYEKAVTKTIQYDRFHPCIMARSSSKRGLKNEMRAMRVLRGAAGVISAEGLMRYKIPDSTCRPRTIITKIYNAGSLQDALNRPSLRLSLREKISIATDLITGLASIHSKGLVHRDLSARNCFVHIESGGLSRRHIIAVVADLGRSLPASKAIHTLAQGNKGYLPPEGFSRNKLHRTGYYRADIFALGTVFWRLYYGRPAPWQARRYFSDTTFSLKKRQQLTIDSIHRARLGPARRLHEKIRRGTPLTLSDKMAQLILQMTDPVAARRGTARQLKERFLELYA
jgi:serine/threonine protein kinase